MLYTKHNHIMYVLSYCSYQHNHILQLLTIRLPYFFKFIRQLLRGFFSQICLKRSWFFCSAKKLHVKCRGVRNKSSWRVFHLDSFRICNTRKVPLNAAFFWVAPSFFRGCYPRSSLPSHVINGSIFENSSWFERLKSTVNIIINKIGTVFMASWFYIPLHCSTVVYWGEGTYTCAETLSVLVLNEIFWYKDEEKFQKIWMNKSVNTFNITL